MKFKTYEALFAEIKQRIAEAQIKTATDANAQMLLLYWQMGNDILQNQQAKGWGAKIIDQLSADLKKEFPQLKGLSPRNLSTCESLLKVILLPSFNILFLLSNN